MRNRRPVIVAIVAVATAGGLMTAAPTADAFVEDLCFGDGGTATNCYPIPAVCMPAGTTSDGCKAAAFQLYTQNGAGDPALGVRSTVHTDSVFVIAQAVGFSSVDAYWIAAYSGSIDYGRVFVPYNLQGQPVTTWNGMALGTEPLIGFDRLLNSANVPSFFIHFITPYNGGADSPVPGINGLEPQVTNAAVEPELASFQTWSLADFKTSSAAAPLCAAGLTVENGQGDFGSGSTCFAGTGLVPAHVGGSVAAAGNAAITEIWDAGPAVIQLEDAGPVLATDFDAYIGAHAADARLGLFVHVLADRVSHFRCEDDGQLQGPTAGRDGGFFANLTNPNCDQPTHAMFHLWETGIPFNYDASVGSTTNAVLGDIYDQLVTFATAHGVLKSGAGAANARTAMVSALDVALQLPSAADRVTAIAHLACTEGLAPLPGTIECPDAGTAHPDAGATAHDAAVGSVTKDAGTISAADATVKSPTTTPTTPTMTSPTAEDASTKSGGCSASGGEVGSAAVWGIVAFCLGAYLRRRRGQSSLA